ncbi:MAG: hypothetical protein K6A96_02385 [Prevotella sp.]|jgi:hypothetical protein|nr:hypothetical protein [Prevotella sp.]
MKRSEQWANAVLVVLVVVLLAICIRSVVHEQRAADKRQELRDVRNE